MKNNNIQFFRGLAIICVVLIHTLSQVDNNVISYINITIRTIINFCVAMFIFISAYLIDEKKIKKNCKEFYIKKVKRLLIPFFIWSLFYTLLKLINHDNISIFKELIKFLIGANSAQLYYIIVLVQFFLLTPIILKIKENSIGHFILYIIQPIYLLIVFLTAKYNISIPLYNYFMFGWLSYYVLGVDFKNKNYNINNIVIVILTAVIIIINLLEYKMGFDYSYCASQIKITNLVYSTIIITWLFEKIKIVNSNNILVKIGDYSYGIYYIHIFFVIIINKAIEFIKMPYYINVIIAYILTITTSILFIFIFKKITKNKFNKYLGF